MKQPPEVSSRPLEGWDASGTSVRHPELRTYLGVRVCVRGRGYCGQDGRWLGAQRGDHP